MFTTLTSLMYISLIYKTWAVVVCYCIFCVFCCSSHQLLAVSLALWSVKCVMEVMNRFSKHDLMCEEMRYIFSVFLVWMQAVFWIGFLKGVFPKVKSSEHLVTPLDIGIALSRFFPCYSASFDTQSYLWQLVCSKGANAAILFPDILLHLQGCVLLSLGDALLNYFALQRSRSI